MRRSIARLAHLVLLWAIVTLAVWPSFVVVATLIGLWSGEARQLDVWTLEPKRTLLAAFLDGWIASLVVAAAVGLVAVVDHLLLSRHGATRLVGGVLLPLAGVAVALTFYPDPVTALPTLAVTGLLLAVLYRLFEGGRRRLTGAHRR